MRYYILMAMMLLLGAGSAKASAYDDTSVAGLFPVSNQGREVWNFNPNWRFHLGDVLGAERADYDDTSWGVVSTPHSVKLEPAEASGCRNYQGIAWYRKTFIVPGNRSEIYFEAIMGKQKIYVNGKLAKEHFGGYLPVIVNLKEQGLKKGDKCVVAVMADNSNDKSYPPGKPQYTLDFAYHGGIYRDVWLINKKEVSITNVIEADRRDAGIFVHFSDISEKQAKVFVDVDLQNVGGKARKVKVEQSLLDASGKVLKTISQNVLLAAGDAHQTVRQMFSVRNPHLWSPETPYLYSVVTRIRDGKQVLDGGKTKLGIRSFEFRGKEGFWLNGKKYRQFIGANRHQDFAYVGNALPNSQQWRDVLRLKNAGFNIIRTAHYPQDPSFMDACDELGIFIIVATPGWQYWNKDPQFAERVFQNTREIIRRDRNHPSVLMWEPILNETRYPKDFALKSLQLTKDEYPYPYRPVAVADWNSAGVKENYDVVYGWPDMDMSGISQCVFTREFGEYVDDWYAHNNLNRASRSWGEKPMLTQAYSLAKTTEEMHTPGQFIGGCQWHPFDHQRGYHPDPYWGGIYDAFRQKKTAYYMFESQRSDQPFVHIAHEMTQFSDADVTVFSNCDSVRLTTYQFIVEVMDATNPDSHSTRELTITILPPWWATWWAYLIYIILISVASYYAFRYAKYQIRLKNNIYIQNQLAEYKRKFNAEQQDKQFADKVRRFMEANLTNADFEIDMLAQELGMSRSAFFKKTKAVMGCSPSDMVKDFKLSHAVELLKHSGQSITDVAYCCGFTDVGYFGKCFRKKYGMSPREYVAQQQESEIKK